MHMEPDKSMNGRYDAILVLGCGIDEKGELGDDALSSVKMAADLFNQQAVQWLIFCGGVSYKADFAPPIGEAQAMKDYAVKLGIPADKILVEAGSKDTLGNAYFSKVNLLMPLGLRSVAILRGPNHSEERLRYIFQKVLGPDYKYDFILRDEVRPEERERESKSLSLLRNWLDDVKDGDDAAVYAILRAKHPGYSSDPKATEKLQQLMEQV